MNIFYSEVDPAVQLELNARGLSGQNRTTQDLNFMLGKIANVQITAYSTSSADPNYVISGLGTLGGQTVRTGRYLPSSVDQDGNPIGFLTNPKYDVETIVQDKDGNYTYADPAPKLDDISRRIGPIITAVSVDIGDHSMGLLNKATINITIPNPTRDLDVMEDIWFYPGRYVKIDIEHPDSAIITGANSNLISTASLFGSLSEDVINNKLKKIYPNLTSLDSFKREIRKLNKFSFQGLITSFDFSYSEDGSVEATLSLTGTSNTYTDVSMLMNPETTKTENKKTAEYFTVATSSVAELQAQNQPTGSTEFYGQLYHEFERIRNNFKTSKNLTDDSEVLITFTIDNVATPATDQFILYGQLYPNVQTLPTYQRPIFTENTASAINVTQQSASFAQQQDLAEQSFNSKRQTYTSVQRYITLGGLVQFINTKLISKIAGAAAEAKIICQDDIQFSNYYPSLTSSDPRNVLLLPKNSNLSQEAGGMNVYGQDENGKAKLTMFPNVVNLMSSYSDIKQWLGIASTNLDNNVIYPSRIFLNLEMIQTILNSVSASNTKSFTLYEFLANISSNISAATGGAINLKLVSDPNLPNVLYFSDTKYLKPLNTKKPVDAYSVPMLANHPNGTIVREFSFQAKLPSNVKNLSYVLNAGTNVSEDEVAPYLNFMYNSKDPEAKNRARAKYKEKHQQIKKNLNDAKNSYSDNTLSPEQTIKLNKALIEYIKYPYDDISKSQQLTAPIFPFDVEFTIDGINGLRYGDVLTFEGLPEKYKKNTVFSIIGITHDVGTEGDWVQKVKCIMRPKVG